MFGGQGRKAPWASLLGDFGLRDGERGEEARLCVPRAVDAMLCFILRPLEPMKV